MGKIVQVTSPSMPPFEEFVEEIRSLWDSRWLTHNGPKHKLLTQRVAEYLNVPNICLYTNGHMALEMALEALNLKGEVITTPYTFASTTHAIVRRGLKPRFCDINPETFNIDADKIETLITKNTCAILPVHVYGIPCDTKSIDEIAKRYRLKVIYDAAHAFGVRVNGRGIGCFGDMSMFSFHATKVFHTVEGGALAYSDENLTPLLMELKQFGTFGREDAVISGSNAKMTEMSAAMGLCNLRHIDEEIEKRRKVFYRYLEHLEGVAGIRLLSHKPNVQHNWAYFPVVFDGFKKDRETVMVDLNKEGIIPRRYFYPITSQFECYRGVLDIESTPVAEFIASHVLTLPLYADMDLNDVDRVCSIILKK